MAGTAPQIQEKTAAEIRFAAVDFQGLLDDGELLTGTPTLASAPTGLTFANTGVNAAELEINGVTAAIGQAVQFKVTGGTSGTAYVVTVTCGTDGTPAQTLVGKVKIVVQD